MGAAFGQSCPKAHFIIEDKKMESSQLTLEQAVVEMIGQGRKSERPTQSKE